MAQHVGRQIAAARRHAGLTQAELGERMGITQATISEMENTSPVYRGQGDSRQVVGYLEIFPSSFGWVSIPGSGPAASRYCLARETGK
jgi:transcriptional regulator with XRE-family HTH domain